MATTHPSSIRLPAQLRGQLRTAAEVEGRTFSSVLLATIERGLAARCADQQVIRQTLHEVVADDGREQR